MIETLSDVDEEEESVELQRDGGHDQWLQLPTRHFLRWCSWRRRIELYAWKKLRF